MGSAPVLAQSRFTATDGLQVVHLDDDIVVFHPASWFSHFLNPAAAAVLESIVDRPRSRNEIEALLFEILDETEKPSSASHTDAVIESLSIIGLIKEAVEDPDAHCGT